MTLSDRQFGGQPERLGRRASAGVDPAQERRLRRAQMLMVALLRLANHRDFWLQLSLQLGGIRGRPGEVTPIS
jgi:hypothetical protein